MMPMVFIVSILERQRRWLCCSAISFFATILLTTCLPSGCSIRTAEDRERDGGHQRPYRRSFRRLDRAIENTSPSERANRGMYGGTRRSLRCSELGKRDIFPRPRRPGRVGKTKKMGSPRPKGRAPSTSSAWQRPGGSATSIHTHAFPRETHDEAQTLSSRPSPMVLYRRGGRLDLIAMPTPTTSPDPTTTYRDSTAHTDPPLSTLP